MMTRRTFAGVLASLAAGFCGLTRKAKSEAAAPKVARPGGRGELTYNGVRVVYCKTPDGFRAYAW